jgi:flap endonuclease-1
VSALGVNLTPIIIKHDIQLKDLAGKKLAVDANNFLYQFISVIRTRDTAPLTSPDGTVTSHLAGLLYRITHLTSKYNMGLVFVFDGKPPKLKQAEIEKRHQLREKANKEWKEALEKGDYSKAFSKAVMSGHLTMPMIQDAKKLLALLGIPYVQAPSEAEAQAAYMAMKGDVWASSTKDYDSLLFGTPRLVRYLTIYGKEYLPSKGVSRPLKPELIILEEFLSKRNISRVQLIDLAILMGTDFNKGVKGIGPKTALKLIKEYKSIESLPKDIQAKINDNYEEVRNLFLKPDVTLNYNITFNQLRESDIFAFLCDEKGFSRERVEKAINRMKRSFENMKQSNLGEWMWNSF